RSSPRTASRRSPARREPPTWRDGAWTSPLPWRTPWPAPRTEILTTPPGPHPPPGRTPPPRPPPPPRSPTPPPRRAPPRPTQPPTSRGGACTPPLPWRTPAPAPRTAILTTPPGPHPPPGCFPGWDLRSPAP